MAFKNLPADWTKPHIVLVRGIKQERVADMLLSIQRAIQGESQFAVIETGGEQWGIEFIELPQTMKEGKHE